MPKKLIISSPETSLPHEAGRLGGETGTLSAEFLADAEPKSLLASKLDASSFQKFPVHESGDGSAQVADGSRKVADGSAQVPDGLHDVTDGSRKEADDFRGKVAKFPDETGPFTPLRASASPDDCGGVDERAPSADETADFCAITSGSDDMPMHIYGVPLPLAPVPSARGHADGSSKSDAWLSPMRLSGGEVAHPRCLVRRFPRLLPPWICFCCPYMAQCFPWPCLYPCNDDDMIESVYIV
jgi:X-X-X-Leu-X-X-Gly heptad repeat protein